MTNPKWLIAVLCIFVGCTIWCGVSEGVYLAGTDIAGRFGYFTTWPGWLGIPGWIINFFGILLFDYSFFHGDWVIVRYAIFMPIGIALIVSYGALLLPSILTGLRSLGGVVAGLFGLGGA